MHYPLGSGLEFGVQTEDQTCRTAKAWISSAGKQNATDQESTVATPSGLKQLILEQVERGTWQENLEEKEIEEPGWRS